MHRVVGPVYPLSGLSLTATLHWLTLEWLDAQRAWVRVDFLGALPQADFLKLRRILDGGYE